MNNKPSKFIIFANVRTGSTSLANVLGESVDVKMLIEPFHDDFTKWNPDEKNYSKYVKDEKTLNIALDEKFSKYTAIKELQYRQPEKLSLKLLARKDIKIIFLTRRDTLALVISAAVAEQTSTWHKKDAKKDTYKDLKPLNVEKLKRHYDYTKNLNNTYLNFLKKERKDDYIHVFYEDLYTEDIDKNTAKLKEICDFLHIQLPPKEAILQHMLPSKVKVNYNDIYKEIPNYEEIINFFN